MMMVVMTAVMIMRMMMIRVWPSFCLHDDEYLSISEHIFPRFRKRHISLKVVLKWTNCYELWEDELFRGQICSEKSGVLEYWSTRMFYFLKQYFLFFIFYFYFLFFIFYFLFSLLSLKGSILQFLLIFVTFTFFTIILTTYCNDLEIELAEELVKSLCNKDWGDRFYEFFHVSTLVLSELE